MSDAPGAVPTAQPATTTPTNTPSWTAGITDAEVIGHAQTKGWDKLDAASAFQEAVRAHRNAEKMIGAPPDKLLRLPTNADDEAGWKQVWQKLGAPDKAEDYSFEGIDFDDPEMTSRFASTIRSAASELNMPKAMAERMAQQFHKFVSDAGAANSAESSARVQQEQQKLIEDWGKPDDTRFKANMFIARSAADKLGINQQVLDKIGDALGQAGMGYADTIRMFHKIGLAMGEDRYVSGSNPSNGGMMGREQAIARRGELMADRQWTERYLSGGAAELREMTALNTLISGGP